MTDAQLKAADGVAARLAALVAGGRLQADPHQAEAARALDRVIAGLNGGAPAHSAPDAPTSPTARGFKRLLRRSTRVARALAARVSGRERSDAPPEGLYLYGGVGRGKTMLMDLFFAALPETAKRRVHFNDFMAEVHDRINAERRARGARAGRHASDDPIPPVARAIRREARVLCFDEFSVTDIADAMVLSRLFSALFAQGLVLVATSNVAPRDLYPDGLNRALFMPFVDLLEAHTRTLALDGPLDYRAGALARLPVYLTPLGPTADRAMDEAWAAVTAGRREGPEVLRVMGREVRVPRAAWDAARMTFADLCEAPLGARDYLALTARFSTLLLDRVPVLGATKRNEAKRFILLVDTLYDRRRRLILSAAAEPEALIEGVSGTERFEWARTASRLTEMRGDAWREVWAAQREQSERVNNF